MRVNRHAQGAQAEAQAAAYLVGKGMRLLTQNLRLPGGEVDLVLEDGAYTVFVEVKQRRSARYGTGREAVDARKQRRICQVAVQYLVAQGRYGAPVRFDVVEIQNRCITHIPNAFSFVPPA